MLKIFKRLQPKEWLMAGFSLIFIVAQVWLDLKLPDFMSQITKLTQTPGSAMNDIWSNGGYMLLCALGSLAAAVIVGFFAARISASFSQRLRSLIFAKVETFSMEEINRFSTASLITRSTNDITQVQMLVVMALQLVVKAPIMSVWAISKIAGKGVEWSLVTGAGVLIVLFMVILLMIFVVPKFKKMQILTDNITRVTRENLTGLRVVRAYNAEDYQEDKFSSANNELTGTQMFTSRAMATAMPVMTVVMSGLSLAIYWIGAYLIDAAGV
ncbi:MAG: ABC transporter ATP-binding protein, partial [Clostridia bacterium]|nr:ABC transporter ATP-binding protein [Clostridia bacterium]